LFMIVLHPRQNIEGGLKWQTCFGTVPSEVSCLSGKGLSDKIVQSSRYIVLMVLVSRQRCGRGGIIWNASMIIHFLRQLCWNCWITQMLND